MSQEPKDERREDAADPIDQTQPLAPAGQDDPLSVFDQPTQQVPYSGPGYAAPPSQAPEYQSKAYETSAWTRPSQPLVKTTPRTGTIVWGFIILAIGVGAVAVGAGARLDVGLAMIWLLAAAGTVLVAASILGAVRRRGRRDSTAQHA